MSYSTDKHSLISLMLVHFRSSQLVIIPLKEHCKGRLEVDYHQGHLIDNQ